jgi:hypothetical protein
MAFWAGVVLTTILAAPSGVVAGRTPQFECAARSKVRFSCPSHGRAMTSSIHDEMLGDMPAMRMAIGLHFKWYYHVTPMRNVAPIRKEGLLPKRDKTAPDIVKKYAGSSASNLICLNPLGADVVPPTVQVGPFACLAIVNEALPMRLSLDWSYGGAFGIAEVLRSENANRPASSIFVESAKRWGSIVAYDAIPKEVLRAYRQGCMPHDPSRWPMLTVVTDDVLQIF